MNEQTTQLINELANKLGTTSEYLWSVLLKQAPISATVDLLMSILCVVVGFLLYKLHRKFSVIKGDSDYNESYYEYQQWPIALMVFLSIAWIIWIVASICSVNAIISGYFNPEYWALKEVLSAIN